MQRRTFLYHCGRAAAAGGLACGSALPFANRAESAEQSDAQDWPVALFTKGFQTHTYDQLAEVVVQTGADGIEAPIRRGGHIEPAEVAEELPKMVEALGKRDKRVLIAATDVTTASNENEAVLRALKDNGVEYYRTGYYRYERSPNRLQQVRHFTEQAKELAALNEEVGIVGVYQNHAGDRYLGSLIWDLAMMFEQIDSQRLGVALDLRHLRAEVGVSWQSMIDLIRPHVLTVFVKNATWVLNGEPRITNVPLDEGLADKSMFRNVWKGIDRPAPLSVHVEYLGQQPVPPGETEEMIAACRRDVAVLRSWMAG